MIRNLIDYAGNRGGLIATFKNIEHAAGADIGQAVTVVVAPKEVENALPHGLPWDCGIFASPSQACFATISRQTPTSFAVTLTPPPGVKLAKGSFNVAIVG